MMLAVERSEPFLPNEKPRYAMGLGTPPQLLELIARGVDMFDCVSHSAGPQWDCFHRRRAPQSQECGVRPPKCADRRILRLPSLPRIPRGYLRHLVKAEEILGLRLITLHNLYFYLELMRRARQVIEAGTFDAFRRQYVAGYRTNNVTATAE